MAWMTAITRNEAARWHASKAARLWSSTVERHALETGPHAPSVDAGDRVLDRLAVESAVAELAHGDRRLLALRYEQDLTYAELAERLGTAEGAAKVRLHRLRRRLRVVLES